jgi:hypothetical protein
MVENPELEDAPAFFRRGGATFIGILFTTILACAGAIVANLIRALPDGSPDDSFGRTVLWTVVVTLPGTIFLLNIFIGVIWSRIPLAAFLWWYLALILAGVPAILTKPPVTKLMFVVLAFANVAALRIVHDKRFRMILQETRRRYELGAGPHYGYQICLGELAIFSSVTFMMLLWRKLGDAIEIDLFANKGPLYFVPGLIGLVAAICAMSRLERSSRRPIIGLFAGQLLIVGLLSSFDFLLTSRIDPWAYPPLVLALSGLFVARSSGIVAYMNGRAAKRWSGSIKKLKS